MKYSAPLLLAVALWLVPTTLCAQAKQTPAPQGQQSQGQQKQTPTPPAPTTPKVTTTLSNEDDVIGIADVLDIQVGNHGDLDQIATVGRDGKITLKELGQFVAAGKSRAVLQNEIQVAADKTLNNAPVYVSMKEKHLEHFTIDGGVTAPGVYPLYPGSRISDAISAAHGLPMKPLRYTAKLVRRDQTMALNVPKIYTDPESDANMVLMPNDKLVFNEIDIARRRVTILGQIARPSTYDIDTDTNILVLINQAGGLSPAAALTKTIVARGNTTISLNLRPTLMKGSVDPNVLNFHFQDGDVVSIPGVETKYQVLGQVNHPSSYIYPEEAKITVLDALSTAGGPTPMANMNGAKIRRVVDGKVTLIDVHFDKLQKKGVAEANIPIQADDILIIPERGKRGITLNDVFAPLGLLNLLGFRLFN